MGSTFTIVKRVNNFLPYLCYQIAPDLTKNKLHLWYLTLVNFCFYKKEKNAFFLSKSVSVMILKNFFIILLKVRLDNWKKKNVLCMFASLLSLAHSHVVHSLTALINSSRLALALCVCVCVFVCIRVCACVRAVHSPPRGQGVTLEPQGHRDISLPPSLTVPRTPLAFCSSPGWQPCIRQTHTDTGSAPPPTPARTHTHTPLASPPPARGRSIQLFAFHLTRALEELCFLKKTQYSIPFSG